jgi:hypothetical protein
MAASLFFMKFPFWLNCIALFAIMPDGSVGGGSHFIARYVRDTFEIEQMLGFVPLTPTGYSDMRSLECILVSFLRRVFWPLRLESGRAALQMITGWRGRNRNSGRLQAGAQEVLRKTKAGRTDGCLCQIHTGIAFQV